jgi:DNA-binding transcriptional MocR family regulator
MYEPLPRMTQHLISRYNLVGHMAGALYDAIGESGLRLPARRDLARAAGLSEATVSRRLREVCSEERLTAALMSARDRTFPPGWHEDGWERWLPGTELELGDLRVWLACLELAATSPAAAQAVSEAWSRERRDLAAQPLDEAAPPELSEQAVADATVLQGLVLGLSVRRLLDSGFSHDHSVALLARAVAALRDSAAG